MPAEQLTHRPTLKELLEGIVAAPPVALTGIASDSRNVERGALFLACPGEQHHGADFIAQAIEAGAAAVLFDATTANPEVDGVPVFGIEDLPAKIGTLTNRFYSDPSAAVRVIGVTGTNGKTTVSWLAAQCLTRLGNRCGYVGTLGSGIDTISESTTLTTPDAATLQQRLASFRDQAASFASIEVSSHALDQNRIAGVSFDTVLFTNLSRDHLDYHGSMQAYAEAKAKLFTATPALRRIINLDSEFGMQLANRCGQDVITVSTNFDRVANGRPYVFVRSVVARESGSQVTVASSWGETEFLLPLVGDFNVANAVIVLALLLSLGVPLADASAVLADVEAPPGRMQRVPDMSERPGPSVYVDYAH
ncbi:MAG: UDP-N-acetylmuramoyl-L-alanyl-D-glutamate--2,6-diaminopimelate ligase, partial [Pseudomonadota bacterium]